jgi:hypothetical protein
VFAAAALAALLTPTYPVLQWLWIALSALCCWLAWRNPGAAFTARQLIVGVNGQVLLKTGVRPFERGALLPRSWSNQYFAVINLQLTGRHPLGLVVLAANQQDAFRRLRCRCRHSR